MPGSAPPLVESDTKLYESVNMHAVMFDIHFTNFQARTEAHELGN